MHIRSHLSVAGAHPWACLETDFVCARSSLSAISHGHILTPVSTTGRRHAGSHKLCCKGDALRLMAINSLGNEGVLVVDGKNSDFCKSCSKTDSVGLAEMIHSLLSCAFASGL